MNGAQPIIELIAQNLLAALQQITTGNGYFQTISAIRAVAKDVNPSVGVAVLETGIAEDTDAPYAQAGRKQYFLVTRWLRKPESSTQPIDQAMFQAASDIETAVMADPRRGGLVDVDTIVHAPQCITDAAPFPTVQVLISVTYVTDRQDPTSIPAANRNAKFYQGAPVLSFSRCSAGGYAPWRDFRGVKLVPVDQPQTVEFYDSSSGVKRPVKQQTSQPNEKYEFTTRSLSPDDLVFLFGASTVADFTQASTPAAAVPHKLIAVDCILPLVNSQGRRVFNLASIDHVTSGDGLTTYAAGTDYIVDSQGLATGRLKIPPTSTIAPGTILVSYTPNAISGRRQFVPQSSTRAQGRAEIIWLAADSDVMVRSGVEISIVPIKPEFSESDYSDLRFTVTVLADQCDPTRPPGAFIIARGTIPAIGY